MRIVFLGWGSLIWYSRELPIISEWLQGGPFLPIEFSRVSSQGRLTLVVDQVNGVGTPTRYAISSSGHLAQAVSDLKKRENTSTQYIGYVDVTTNTYSSTHYVNQVTIHNSIADWAMTNNFDAVVWTALPSNFKDKTGDDYSVEAALSYINGLVGDEYTNATEYIVRAPEDVLTPFRKRFNDYMEI